MPQLTFRGISPDQVAIASAGLPEKLAAVLDCPQDYFTFDFLNAVSFFNGLPVPTAPFIEILWFERGKTVQDNAAMIITEALRDLGVEELEICFKPVPTSAYYGNGIPYDRE